MSAIDRRIEPRYASFRGWVRLRLANAEFRAGRLKRFASIDFSKVERLVFVCQGNICRSSFAEFVARRSGVSTASFGLQAATGERAFPRAIATATAFGIDLDRHRVTDIADFEFRSGDLLATMEVRQARRLSSIVADPGVQITLVGLWSTPFRPHIHDPYEHSDAYFATCFRTLQSGVHGLVSRWRPDMAREVSD
ncbi:MAG: phosphotyrosine protein phosphatase [Betaproteobacteria bacterium]